MREKGDKYYWRLFATGLSFTVFGIGGIILGYVMFPVISLFYRSKDAEQRRCRYLVHMSFKAFAWFMQSLGVLRWEVGHDERLRKEGQLIVANHPSLIDIVFLISLVPNASCIVKSEVYRNPFMRGPVRRAGYIPNHSPEQLITDCVEELRKGTSLVVFPEGTRSVRSRPLKFRRGAAHLWLRARCAVTRVTITAEPPMLAKHEKWYEIPDRRSNFRLNVKQPEFPDEGILTERETLCVRTTTKKWKKQFTREITA